MIGIVYDEDYNKYDLGLDHPLIGDKPRRTMEFFKEKNLLKEIKIFNPKKATVSDLLRVHEKVYIEKIKNSSKTGGILTFDTPIPVGIFDIALLVTGGTMLAGDKLFNGFQKMVNPLAGFHHASRSTSSGFCFFNDIAVTIEYIRKKYNVKRFEIIDLDVHHANGTQEIYYSDPTVLKISFHQDGRTLYPGTGSMEKIGKEEGEGYNINFPFPPGTSEKNYIKVFDEIIPTLTNQFKPELIIYQSGVDTHYSDPLADINLSYQTFYYLSKKIYELSKNLSDKLLVLFGGGYNGEAAKFCYYNIMCGLMEKFDIIKEEIYKDINSNLIDNLIDDFKKIIHPYWEI